MKRIICASVIIFSFLNFSGCSKSSSGGASASFTILSSAKWQLVSDTAVRNVPGGGTQTVDVFAGLAPCVTDNYLLFNSDGTFTTDEGATKCNSSDPQTKLTGIWLLSSSDVVLQMPDPVSGLVVTGNIVQLDDNTLKFQFSSDIGVQAVNTEVFKHIK